MARLAIIPARGGSKRLPGKNLALVGGAPLLAHSIRQARASELVDHVIVSTDSAGIAAVAASEGAAVVMRPSELASDDATSESALLHALDSWRAGGNPEPSLVVFLQCTSPIRSVSDIDDAIRAFESSGADSLLSVCENTRFVWAMGPDGARSINYDYRNRRREQDLEPQFQENGSIYVFPPALLRRQGNRLGGRIAVHVMDYWSSFQIDTPEDLVLIDWLMRRTPAAIEWPAALDLVVLDFDGVMTDNRVLVASDGTEAVLCSRADGMGLERLRKRGVPVLVLSKETNPVVTARCDKLKLACVQGIDDKRAYLAAHLRERNIDAARVAYLGNDINDLDCMSLVGLPVAVADAYPEVIRAARLVLNNRGGQGAVRELCDLIIARLDEDSSRG